MIALRDLRAQVGWSETISIKWHRAIWTVTAKGQSYSATTLLSAVNGLSMVLDGKLTDLNRTQATVITPRK